MIRNRARSAAFCLLAFAAACGCEAENARPVFVDRLVAREKAAPKKNPPGAIWRYSYQGRTVYYVPPSCCDVPGELYDGEGYLICLPDGGITGDGDGTCPDFFDVRSDEEQIWADDR